MKIAVVMMDATNRERSFGSQVCAALDVPEHQVVPVQASKNLALTLRQERPDLCFVAAVDSKMKGIAVQELLHVMDIPFVGTNPATAKRLDDCCSFEAAFSTYTELTDESLVATVPVGFELSVAAFEEFGARAAIDTIEKLVPGGYPMCVKPRFASAGEGFTRVEDETQLKAACESLVSAGCDVLVQQWVEGIVLHVAVLGEGWDAYSLPPAVCNGKGVFEAPVPSNLLSPNESMAQAIRSEIERAAVEACRAFGVRDAAQVDLLWDGAQARILGIDPFPDMVSESAFGVSCEAAGIGFEKLVRALVGILA